MNVTWTEARVARLSELWLGGVSARLIAIDMNLSKNAVVGKAHRLELAGRPSPILHCARAAPESKTQRQAACKPPKRLEHHSGGHMPTGRTVVHTAKMAAGARFKGCQWIQGEKGVDFKLYAAAPRCLAETRPGSPYCPAHHMRCHVKTQSARAA